jgi:hypothetical protein
MWKRFHFESNRFFDSLKGPEDWLRLRAAFSDTSNPPTLSDDELLDAKEATYGNTLCAQFRKKHPNYGFAQEHDGVKRLRDFFEENDMLRLLPGQDAKDAARYRWLRAQHWTDETIAAVVINGPRAGGFLPGSDCPSGQRLDEAIDRFMKPDNVSESIEHR